MIASGVQQDGWSFLTTVLVMVLLTTVVYMAVVKRR